MHEGENGRKKAQKAQEQAKLLSSFCVSYAFLRLRPSSLAPPANKPNAVDGSGQAEHHGLRSQDDAGRDEAFGLCLFPVISETWQTELALITLLAI